MKNDTQECKKHEWVKIQAHYNPVKKVMSNVRRCIKCYKLEYR